MSEFNYAAIRTADIFERWVDKLIKEGLPVGFDIEASYSAPEYIEKGATLQFHPSWFMVSFSFSNARTFARTVPIAHDDDGNVDDPVRVARDLWRLLNSCFIIAHNLPYEIKGTRRFFKAMLWNDPVVGEDVRAKDGIWLRVIDGKPQDADTMVQVWMSGEYEPKRAEITSKDLKGSVEVRFGHIMTHFDELFMEDGKKAKKDKRFNELSSYDKKNIDYACEDALWCLALDQEHRPTMETEYSTLYQIEMLLIPVLIQMEIDGLYIDWDAIALAEKKTIEFRDKMAEEIYVELSKRLDRTVNINLRSSQQLQKILYSNYPEGLGLPVKFRTPAGAPQTGEEALRQLAKVDVTVRQLLEWKELSTLLSSYLTKYLTRLHYSDNGYAYPNHNQAGTVTGRMSVDQVSYQQWPKPYHYELKSGEVYDLNFRDFLISPPGYRILGYDFSQVELRFLAGIANETAMLQAFKDDIDIHKATAASMFNIPLDQVTKQLRAKGKTGNFAVVYQSGAANMAELMGTSKEEAEELLDAYYAAFGNLRGWMDQNIANGREQGYVKTVYGRRFTLWEHRDPRPFIQSKGDRMCVNAPIQGGAADYMKIGMVRVDRVLKKAVRDGVLPPDWGRLIASIHDALEFYVREDIDSQLIIDLVTPAVSFPVKQVPTMPQIRTDWHEGRKWGSVVEIKLDKETHKIKGYAIEDVDEEFKNLVDAYAKLDAMHDEKYGKILVGGSYENPEDELAAEWAEINAELSTDEADIWPVDPLVEEDPPWLHAKDTPVENKNLAEGFHPTPVTLTITVMEMPTAEEFERLTAILDDHQGENYLILSTPEGDVPMPDRHNLLNQDQGVVSMALRGARFDWGPQELFFDVRRSLV